MPNVDKISGVATTAISKVDGVLLTSTAKVAGQTVVTYENTKSMDFDGTNDYISIGTTTDLDFAFDDAFSISCWVNTDGTNYQNFVFSKNKVFDNYPSYGGWGYGLYMRNQLIFKLDGDAWNSYIQAVWDTSISGGHWDSAFYGTWHHIVCTYDGSGVHGGLKIYLDSIDNTGTTSGGIYTSSLEGNGADFVIGGSASGSWDPNVTDGKIDEVAVFDYELTQGNVNTIYNGTAPTGTDGNWDDGTGEPADLSSLNPIGWWRLGDKVTSFPTIPDQGSGGNDGTATNMDVGDIGTDVPPTT